MNIVVVEMFPAEDLSQNVLSLVVWFWKGVKKSWYIF